MPEVIYLDPNDCIPMPELGRDFYEPAEYSSLKGLLKEEGWLYSRPARARSDLTEDNKYEFFSGIHRLKIAKEIGLKSIPVVLENIDRTHAIAAALKDNTQGKYNPLDRANHLKALKDSCVLSTQKELTMRELSTMTHLGLRTVVEYLHLLDLPTDTKVLVGTGRLGLKHALVLLKLKDPMNIDELAEECVNEHWTVSKTELKVRQFVSRVFKNEEFEACSICGRGFPKEAMTRLDFVCPPCSGEIRKLTPTTRATSSVYSSTQKVEEQSATEYMLAEKLKKAIDKKEKSDEFKAFQLRKEIMTRIRECR